MDIIKATTIIPPIRISFILIITALSAIKGAVRFLNLLKEEFVLNLNTINYLIYNRKGFFKRFIKLYNRLLIIRISNISLIPIYIGIYKV